MVRTPLNVGLPMTALWNCLLQQFPNECLNRSEIMFQLQCKLKELYGSNIIGKFYGKKYAKLKWLDNSAFASLNNYVVRKFLN